LLFGVFSFELKGRSLKLFYLLYCYILFFLVLSFCWCFSHWCSSSHWCFILVLKVLFFMLVPHVGVGGFQFSSCDCGCCFSSLCVVGCHYWVCCHFFSFVVLQMFLLLQLIGVLCRPFVFLVASFWPLLWLWSSSCVLGCAPLGHHCGHGRPLMFLVALSWPWSFFCILGCLFLPMVMVFLLCF
jgi:hypothetical protein